MDRSQTGATVALPGFPLTITKHTGGLACTPKSAAGTLRLRAGDLEGLATTFIDPDLGDTRLEYNDASEVAWLVGYDVGDLREACENVARLAPAVAKQMIELEVMAYPPTTTFADRVVNGPWCSASGPGDD